MSKCMSPCMLCMLVWQQGCLYEKMSLTKFILFLMRGQQSRKVEDFSTFYLYLGLLNQQVIENKLSLYTPGSNSLFWSLTERCSKVFESCDKEFDNILVVITNNVTVTDVVFITLYIFLESHQAWSLFVNPSITWHFIGL